MRKITELASNAFYNEKDFNLSNTRVYFDGLGGGFLYLHNNLIAEIDYRSNKLKISSAGWETNTTKERLNGILNEKLLYITQKDFVWYLCETGTKNKVEFKKGNSLN